MLFPVDGRRADRGEGRINENILATFPNEHLRVALPQPNSFAIIGISHSFSASPNYLGSD